MKHAFVVTMLILGMVSLTGCANGPFRGWKRGAPCAPRCGHNVYAPGVSTTGSCNCGTRAVEVYDSQIVLPPSSGIIPPPGPANGQ